MDIMKDVPRVYRLRYYTDGWGNQKCEVAIDLEKEYWVDIPIEWAMILNCLYKISDNLDNIDKNIGELVEGVRRIKE